MLVVFASLDEGVALLLTVKVVAQLVDLLIEVGGAGRRVFLTLDIPMVALTSHNLQLEGASSAHLVHLCIFQELWQLFLKQVDDSIRFL